MVIEKYSSIENICSGWNANINSIYQNIDFLFHLELYNPCEQRYYVGYDAGKVVAGAVVYSLKPNLFTFSRFSWQLPFSVIGIPASVDAAGVIGESEEACKMLITYILQQEKGLILCLNYNQIDTIKKIVKMQTLPTLIFKKKDEHWAGFLNNIKHAYRRRILKATEKILHVDKRIEPCFMFTKEHYNQYLAIMNRTETKLEILAFDFFKKLPDNYQLFSLYHDNELLVWHISVSDAKTYYFLFGGINYELRDKYDSYCNNLISIIKEGFDTPCTTINLGQTALVSKNRLGAEIVPLRMFMYHHNLIIRLVLSFSKRLISYKIRDKSVNVYKSEKNENTLC